VYSYFFATTVYGKSRCFSSIFHRIARLRPIFSNRTAPMLPFDD
jgi:hypothetical protein